MLDALATAFDEAARACACCCTVSSGMPGSLPPYKPSTGAFNWLTTSVGKRGCNSSFSPVILPYQATAALSDGCWAAYSQAIRPPQQKPVTASFETSACGSFLAKATAASKTESTCASGTLD